jgi:hypothetical protein
VKPGKYACGIARNNFNAVGAFIMGIVYVLFYCSQTCAQRERRLARRNEIKVPSKITQYRTTCDIVCVVAGARLVAGKHQRTTPGIGRDVSARGNRQTCLSYRTFVFFLFFRPR